MEPKAGPDETFVVIRYTLKNTSKEPIGRSNQPRAQAAHNVATFREGNCDARLSRSRTYRDETIDAEDGTVSLVSAQGKRVAWSPARYCGDQADA